MAVREGGNFLNCSKVGLVPLSKVKGVLHPGVGRYIAITFSLGVFMRFKRVV